MLGAELAELVDVSVHPWQLGTAIHDQRDVIAADVLLGGLEQVDQVRATVVLVEQGALEADLGAERVDLERGGAVGLGCFGRGGSRRCRCFRFGRRAFGLLVASDERRAAQNKPQSAAPGPQFHRKSSHTPLLAESVMADTHMPDIELTGMSQTLLGQSSSFMHSSGLTFSVHLLALHTSPVWHSKSSVQVLPTALLCTQLSSTPQ